MLSAHKSVSTKSWELQLQPVSGLAARMGTVSQDRRLRPWRRISTKPPFEIIRELTRVVLGAGPTY